MRRGSGNRNRKESAGGRGEKGRWSGDHIEEEWMLIGRK